MGNLIVKVISSLAVIALTLSAYAGGEVLAGVDTSEMTPITELFSADWVQIPNGAKEAELRVAVSGEFITSIGYVLFKKKSADVEFTADTNGTLTYKKSGILSAKISLAAGYQYVIRFQGQSHRPTPALFGGMIKLEPFTVEAQLLDSSGQVFVDSGEQRVSIYKNDPEGLFTAYTAINGQFYLK